MIAPDDKAKTCEDRRTKILKEAANVFNEKGYEGACIDDLIARVGGSKRTIYNEFGSKEGLFVAMIETLVSMHAQQLVAGLDADERGEADLRQVLYDHAMHLMQVVMDPDVLAFQRTIIAEGKRFPKLAEIYYEIGPARSARRLTEILERHRERGEIDVADCRLAVEHFGGLIRDTFFYSVLLGVSEPPPPDEMKRRVTAAVDLFLNGVARRG